MIQTALKNLFILTRMCIPVLSHALNSLVSHPPPVALLISRFLNASTELKSFKCSSSSLKKSKPYTSYTNICWSSAFLNNLVDSS